MIELSRSDRCVRCVVFPRRNSDSSLDEQHEICRDALEALLKALRDNGLRSGIVDLSAYLLEDD